MTLVLDTWNHHALELLWDEGLLLFFFFFKNQSKPKHKPWGFLASLCLHTASPSHRDLTLPWETEAGPALSLCSFSAIHLHIGFSKQQPGSFESQIPPKHSAGSWNVPLQVWCGKSWIFGVFIASVFHSKSISTLQSWKEISMPFKYLLKKEYLWAKEKHVIFAPLREVLKIYLALECSREEKLSYIFIKTCYKWWMQSSITLYRLLFLLFSVRNETNCLLQQ